MRFAMVERWQASSLSSRLARNWSAGVIGQIATIASPLILTPLFLNRWGAADYGIWLTMTAAVTYLSTIDFGAQTYFTNILTELHAKGDGAGFNRLLAKALSFTLALSSIGLAVVLGGLALYGAQPSSRFPRPAVVVFLLALQVLTALPTGVLMGTYRARGEYARSQLVWSGQRLATAVAVAGALVAGLGSEAVAAAHVIPALGCGLFAIRDLTRRHADLHLGLGPVSLLDLKNWCAPSVLFYGVQVLQFANVQGALLLIGWTLGPVAVAAFASTRTIANLIKTATGTMRNAVWNELTALEARGEWERVRQVHRTIMIVTISIASGGWAFLHLGGADLMRMWSHGKIAYDSQLADYLLAGALLEAVWGPGATVLLAGNRPRQLTVAMTAGLALGFAAGTLLLGRMGVAGMALGMVLGELVSTAWIVPVAACRAIADSVFLYARRAAVLLVIMLATCAAVLWPVSEATQSSAAFTRIASLALLSAGVVIAVTGTFLFRQRREIPAAI